MSKWDVTLFFVCQSSIYSKAPAFILADLWVLIMYLKNKNEFYEKSSDGEFLVTVSAH